MRCTSCRQPLTEDEEEQDRYLRHGHRYCHRCAGWWERPAPIVQRGTGSWRIQDYYDHDREPPGVTTHAARSNG